jgi:bla regulator protein BlaR1
VSVPRRRPALPFLLALLLALTGGAPVLAGSFAHGDDGDFEYALVEADRDKGSTISMSGRSFDHLDRLLDEEPGAFLWFALDGRSYLVRDQATIDQAMRITAPMRELGEKQGKLGARQGELGAKQGELGGRQGVLGARQGALAARLASLATRAERRRIEDEMDELGREMEELSRLMEPLSEQQGILGEQQAALGRKQSSATKKAHAELRRLVERAKSDGRARRYEG